MVLETKFTKWVRFLLLIVALGYGLAWWFSPVLSTMRPNVEEAITVGEALVRWNNVMMFQGKPIKSATILERFNGTAESSKFLVISYGDMSRATEVPITNETALLLRRKFPEKLNE
jgi:hypothetical protein